MCPTPRPDGSPLPRALPRRSIVAAGAWTVPVVAVATAAPAYAASPCTGGALNTVTWAGNTGGDGNYTTQTGTITDNSLSVSSVYSSSASGVGSLSASRNMVSPAPGGGTSTSFEMSNNIPPSNVANPAGYWQTTTFTFTKRVATLTFSIDDIDSTTGSTAFWDRVAIIPETGATATGAFRANTALEGAGTLLSPWRTRTENNARSWDAVQSVDVTLTGGFRTFSIRYWTTVGALNNNATPTSTQMWIRINNMRVSSCSS